MEWLPVLNFVIPAGATIFFLWLYGEGLWKKELSLRDKIYFPCFILIFAAIAVSGWGEFIHFLFS